MACCQGFARLFVVDMSRGLSPGHGSNRQVEARSLELSARDSTAARAQSISVSADSRLGRVAHAFGMAGDIAARIAKLTPGIERARAGTAAA
jgi:hypothetical protein